MWIKVNFVLIHKLVVLFISLSTAYPYVIHIFTIDYEVFNGIEVFLWIKGVIILV